MENNKFKNISSITFTLIKDRLDNYVLLSQWLNNDIVHQWYEENEKMSLSKVIIKYRPKILNLKNEKPFFIMYNQHKIGYLQYYLLLEAEKQNLGLPLNQKIFGIDLFIGEVKLLNQGLGTITILNIIKYLQVSENATMFIVDPKINNFSAIRCYEKCGFIKTKILADQWIMILKLKKFNFATKQSLKLDKFFICCPKYMVL